MIVHGKNKNYASGVAVITSTSKVQQKYTEISIFISETVHFLLST